MTGQHIQKLLKATALSDHQKLLDSRKAWLAGFDALDDLHATLDLAAVEVERGFADGVATDEQGTAARGRKAFETLRDDVVAPRRDQMKSAGEVLLTAAQKLNSAELARADMPDSPPGDAPQRPSSYGTEDEFDAIRAQRIYDNQVKTHHSAVTAYGDADEKARKKLEDLDIAYVEASQVLAKIHGEPVYPEDLPPPGEPGPGGFPVGPGGTGHPTTPLPVQHPTPTVHVPGFEPGEDTGSEHVTPGPVGGTLTNPGPANGTGSTGGGGLGINPAIGGGLAAGVFGGPGLVKAVRGALAGRGVFGPTPGAIGSTARTGGASTLGRSGGATPGSPVSRSGGRGGGGGAGGGRPGPGTAGGRGRGGGRGTPGTGAGGRGRKGRDEEGRERDLFDDGSDWIDDEGAGPDVLG
ncbi:MAG: hypothetical protein NTX33_13230 [Propionibacteriales bacterium]|nr:hypothetical protein [Propionibacteriales bacterium]